MSSRSWVLLEEVTKAPSLDVLRSGPRGTVPGQLGISLTAAQEYEDDPSSVINAMQICGHR